MTGIEIGELRRDELPAAAALLARAYRDNPWMVALLADDPDVRERFIKTAHGLRIARLQAPPVVARRGAELLGVCGFDSPVRAPRSPEDQAKFERAAMEAGTNVLGKLQEMNVEFARHGPAEPHWHLGPVGVQVDAQGQGIGSQMVERFCAMLDGNGDVAVLQTELPANVRLYERFGWTTVDEAPVLGVPFWFMLRRLA